MSIVVRTTKPETDDLPRTSWFGPEAYPTIAGEYEARTGGGHVFKRRWNGEYWLNAITGLKSTAPLEWRGVQPGAIEPTRYSRDLRDELAQSIALLHAANWDKQEQISDIPFA